MFAAAGGPAAAAGDEDAIGADPDDSPEDDGPEDDDANEDGVAGARAGWGISPWAAVVKGKELGAGAPVARPALLRAFAGSPGSAVTDAVSVELVPSVSSVVANRVGTLARGAVAGVAYVGMAAPAAVVVAVVVAAVGVAASDDAAAAVEAGPWSAAGLIGGAAGSVAVSIRISEEARGVAGIAAVTPAGELAAAVPVATVVPAATAPSAG